MSNKIEGLQPRCVGRFIIDAPNGALQAGGATINDVKLTAEQISLQDFENEMQAREVTLKSTRSEFGFQFLFDYGKVRGSDKTRYFISLGEPHEISDGARVIEAYKWDNGYQVSVRIKAFDSRNLKIYDRHPEMREFASNNVPEKTNLVFDLVESAYGRNDEVIPTEPGVCFLGGFLKRTAQRNERINTRFVLADKRDVKISLLTDSGIQEKDTLLQRGKQVERSLSLISGGRTVRKGRVSLQGLEAEEWLTAGETQLEVPGNTFTLEANSTIGSAEAPFIALDMKTGAPSNFEKGPIKAASMSEADAVKLWDAVSRTLRPRPNGF
ncbi:putative lipoprotein [Caballeronia ptereochthonis]|uniref:Lipoprotein n=2 Tax=Caballeronia ptereochthonis TaxID=1777144 RepID=A0A158B3W9_9BURK|nr:putative lipoprotein [Caballeronia ptereochthonis]